jgi:hypothetical protein
MLLTIPVVWTCSTSAHPSFWTALPSDSIELFPPFSLRMVGWALINIAETASCDEEPRSGDRYLAWGVSPRIRTRIMKRKPRSGDRHIAPTPAAHAAGMFCRPSGAGILLLFHFLGLTPQAMNMSLLRSFSSLHSFRADHASHAAELMTAWQLHGVIPSVSSEKSRVVE